MPFLLAEILNFQGSTHRIGVGSFSYLSILFMFFNWGLFIITVSAIVMLHLQIVHVEEDFLIKTFGEEYWDYRKKVCRYIGRKR